MTGKRLGRAPKGFAVLILIITMAALSRAPLFGLEWLYLSTIKLTAIAWEVSPALCLMTIAMAGGMVGHRLAMKEVADQLVREIWSRKCRSMPLEEREEVYLQPVRALISSPVQP